MSRPAGEVCEDFCTSKCSFYNESLGETGQPTNITVYRITPKNTTGIQNKDTGDAPGDISFYLARKNLTQQCARDPTSFGCFLDGDNIYGKFVVEIDGQYGPYFECNPINVYDDEDGRRSITGEAAEWGETNYPQPSFIDTRTFECGQGCLSPTKDDCHIYKEVNGSQGFGGAYQCFCDGTARHNKTVGREAPPFAGAPPASIPPPRPHRSPPVCPPLASHLAPPSPGLSRRPLPPRRPHRCPSPAPCTHPPHVRRRPARPEHVGPSVFARLLRGVQADLARICP